MNEEEIFEDQVADYWIDYYRTVEEHRGVDWRWFQLGLISQTT